MKEQKKIFPTIIEYQPYSICNANCAYCPVTRLNREQHQKGNPIKSEILDILIDHTKGHLLERVSPHLNCEPLLCKDLPLHIRRWKDSHPEASLEFSTNGVFLTEKIFYSLVESGLDELTIHFMGVTKEYHEKAMNTKYDKVQKNIENILNLNSENNNPLNIGIFSHRLAGGGISLMDWYKYSKKWKDKGARVTLGPLRNRAWFYGDDFNDISTGILTNKTAPCSKPFNQIAILHDGNVLLCSLDHLHKVKIGNIIEQSIEEIWNSSIMENYRQGQCDPKLNNLTLCKDCIRGGRYLLDETTLTRIVNFEFPEDTTAKKINNIFASLDTF